MPCPAVPLLQALDGFDEEAERKGSQLVRQQARAKAGQKAQAKKAAAKSKGKRNQWSDDESDADLSSSEGGLACMDG